MKSKEPKSEIEKLLTRILHRNSIDPLVFWYFNQVKNDGIYAKNTAMDKRSIAGLFRTLIVQNDPSYLSYGLHGYICTALNKDLKEWIEQGKVSEYSKKTKELTKELKLIIEFADSWYRLNHKYSYPVSWETEFAESARGKND